MKRMKALSIVLLWSGLQALAQEPLPSDSGAARRVTGQLTVEADVDSAIVFVDSVRMGPTPLILRDMEPGSHQIRVVHPDLTNWLTGSIIDTVEVHSGEERVLRYAFGQRFLILSVPSGAEVFIGDSSGGPTPLLLSMQGSDSLRSITLRKPGYDTALVDLSEARRGLATVALQKRWGEDPEGDETTEIAIDQKQSALRIYLAGAVTVGFGTAAAYFKIQADRRNEQYLANMTPSGQSQVRVYDTASAICLVFAEVGFGFLTYFLLAE